MTNKERYKEFRRKLDAFAEEVASDRHKTLIAAGRAVNFGDPRNVKRAWALIRAELGAQAV